MTKTAKHAPTKPSLDDDRQPTNPELWRQVLDVASGERKLYTGIGGREIHAPNKGRGFRSMPNNPMGIAWSIKQYNAYGGGWTPRRASVGRPLVYQAIWVNSTATYQPFQLTRVGAVNPESHQVVLGGIVQDIQYRQGSAYQASRMSDTLDLQLVAHEKSLEVRGLLASQGCPVMLQAISTSCLADVIFRATSDRVPNLSLGEVRQIGGGLDCKYSTMKGSGTLRAVLRASSQDGRVGFAPVLTCYPDASHIPTLSASKVAERFLRES